MSNSDFREEILKYRNREDRQITPGSTVLFKGNLYNKALVESINGDKVNLKVPTKRHYSQSETSDGSIPGHSYTRHINEVIKKDWSSDEYESGVKFLLSNKFKNERVGNIIVEWSKDLEEDMMTLVDGEVINAIDPTNEYSCIKYLKYTKGDDTYLIPATSLVVIPLRRLTESNIGIDKDFAITTERDEIVFPIGRMPEITEDDIRSALLITVESRKKQAMDNLSNTRIEIQNMTDKLAGLQMRNSELVESIDYLSQAKVQEKDVKRAKKILNNQWDDFHCEITQGRPKLTFGGHIIMHRDGKQYDIGFITLEVLYPIPGSGQKVNIKITNTNKLHANPHPYVSTDGRPCFGGHEAEYAKIIGSGDIEALGSFLYGYLTRTVGGGYKKPQDWPEIKPKKVAKEKK